MKWRIEYDPAEEGFREQWRVTDGQRSFACTKEQDAEWLKMVLNWAGKTKARP